MRFGSRGPSTEFPICDKTNNDDGLDGSLRDGDAVNPGLDLDPSLAQPGLDLLLVIVTCLLCCSTAGLPDMVTVTSDSRSNPLGVRVTEEDRE